MTSLMVFGFLGFIVVTLGLSTVLGALREPPDRGEFYKAHRAFVERASPVLSLAKAMSAEKDE
jgi:hypothetical protein